MERLLPHTDGRHLASPADTGDIPLTPCSVSPRQWGDFLCAGYYRYFDHVAPYMDFMKRELLAGRPPTNVMQLFTP